MMVVRQNYYIFCIKYVVWVLINKMECAPALPSTVRLRLLQQQWTGHVRLDMFLQSQTTIFR